MNCQAPIAAAIESSKLKTGNRKMMAFKALKIPDMRSSDKSRAVLSIPFSCTSPAVRCNNWSGFHWLWQLGQTAPNVQSWQKTMLQLRLVIIAMERPLKTDD